MIEKWNTIPGYEKYQVSSFGRVRRITRKGFRMVKPFIKQAYSYIGLCKNGIQNHFRLHRLVAEAFIDNPNNLPFINHIDENKSNNRADNLEWCDALYNANYGNRNSKISEGNSKAVIALDKVSGVELHYFSSMTKASKFVPKANATHIAQCCEGIRKTAGGYKWKYAN